MSASLEFQEKCTKYSLDLLYFPWWYIFKPLASSGTPTTSVMLVLPPLLLRLLALPENTSNCVMLVLECSIGQALGPYEAVQCHPTFPLALAPLSLCAPVLSTLPLPELPCLPQFST